MSGTYVGGIAASQAWDTSGESIDIKDMDTSSLVGSVLNFEHQSGKGADYVGKILKAKKIFSAEDCSNEIELKYWNKCQLPFLYCLGILFDDYQPAAKEVAGIFKFDSEHPELPPTLGFSIEGAKLEKSPTGVITHSIARKLTITAQPANKTCLADKIDLNSEKTPDADPLSFLFKSYEIELFDESTLQKSMNMTPSAPKAPQMPKAGLKQAPTDKGANIGQTKAGHDVFANEKVHNYTHFNAEDHRNAAILHNNAATKANTGKNYKLADLHNQKSKLHNQAAASIERKGNRLDNAMKTHRSKVENKDILNKSEDLEKSVIHEGTHDIGGKIHHIKINKLRSGKYNAQISPGKESIQAPGSIHTLNFTHDSKKNGFKIDHEAPYGHQNGARSEDSNAIRNIVTQKIKEHHEEMSKALTAGGSMVSPGNLEGGAALDKEDLEKEDKLNKPLLDKVPGKNMTSGWKTGMGMSNMGYKVRNGKSAETVFTAKEVANRR